MLKEKGINLEVWFKGEKLTPDKNGYLGEFGEGSFRLEYTLPENESIICFTTGGTKNAVPTKKGFKTIPVTRDGIGTFTTMPANNNIRFAVVGPAGKCEVWKVAILSQDSVFFLAEQKTQEGQWYRDENNEAVCLDSYFTNRPQLMELLKLVMDIGQLPPISQYSPPSEIDFGNLRKRHGKVILWDLPGQWGLIALDDTGTVARVHWSSLPLNMNGGLRRLEVGQVVKFEELREISSTARTTTVSLEAKRVTPL